MLKTQERTGNRFRSTASYLNEDAFLFWPGGGLRGPKRDEALLIQMWKCYPNLAKTVSRHVGGRLDRGWCIFPLTKGTRTGLGYGGGCGEEGQDGISGAILPSRGTHSQMPSTLRRDATGARPLRMQGQSLRRAPLKWTG